MAGCLNRCTLAVYRMYVGIKGRTCHCSASGTDDVFNWEQDRVKKRGHRAAGRGSEIQKTAGRMIRRVI